MKIKTILKKCVAVPEFHAKWLNTLSFMENAGARKISACEDTVNVSLIQLKHAAEEHRHSYYLKKQIAKINPTLCATYKSSELLAPRATRSYLNALDVKACRFLKNTLKLSGKELKFAAYLLVTYAIEVRADALYLVYQELLDEHKSKVMVKSIIVEEEGHLEEMLIQLKVFHKDWKSFADEVVGIETVLYEEWINELEKELL